MTGAITTATAGSPPRVGHFLKKLHTNLTTGLSNTRDGTWFSRRGQGTLFLDRAETDHYYRLVHELVAWSVPLDDLSQKSVETFLADAMFEALDLANTQTIPFGHRLAAAKKNLFARLAAPPQRYLVWLPIEGLKIDGPHARFGGVRFITFGHSQVRTITRNRGVSKDSYRGWKRIVSFDDRDLVVGHVYAAVTVSARDSDAAVSLALRRVRAVIDILNLFTDLVPYCYGWLYLRGETSAAHQVVIVQESDGGLSAKHERLDPISTVSWKALRNTRRLAAALKVLDRLARVKISPDSFASALLSAAQWAGRATVERRRETSFLLYAIALEAMVLPDVDTQGHSFRLRLRVSLLLGRTREERLRLVEEVATLYRKRSRIAHAGSYEVTDAELARLRAIAKGVMFRLLSLKRLHSISRKEFSAELEARLIR